MFGGFKERSRKTERLDRGEYTDAEFQLWQKEMWVIHRLFGEVRAIKSTLLRDVESLEQDEISVLEIAAGSGELLKHVKKFPAGKHLSCVGLELSQESARSIEQNALMAVRADAITLPFADDSFDLAYCTLFLHHLSESEATALLREMRRVAREKIYVIDLERRAIPYYLYKLFGAVFLQRFTRDDGALSIRRAFRPQELSKIASRSGLEDFEIKRSAINRLVLTAKV
jgi:ubiquinone/menaquinone biosynthesis C-methylase UbiE